MQKIMDVEVKEIRRIMTKDTDNKENGYLFDILRADDPIKKDQKNFSQIYVTVAYPGMIKGFHLHKKKTDIFYVVSGTAKLVLIDSRENSRTWGVVNEFILGENNENIAVLVPPGIKHAFKNIGKGNAYILNYMDPAYDHNDPDSESSVEREYKW